MILPVIWRNLPVNPLSPPLLTRALGVSRGTAPTMDCCKSKMQVVMQVKDWIQTILLLKIRKESEIMIFID